MSSLDSAVTNFGAEFEPPDQGLCVGNGFVLEPVNSAYTFYRTNGSVVAGPFNVNVLFGDGLTQFTSDPRCYYDPAANRWIATILFIADDNLSARTDSAVSRWMRISGGPSTVSRTLAEAAPDPATRDAILVTNPARLYGFPGAEMAGS